MKIRTEDFYKAIGAELEDYATEVTDAVKETVEAAAKECKKDIKARAPVREGKYKKSWKTKKKYDGTAGINMIVYASGGEYRLTHLLEKGHAKRGGGRVRGIPHIAPAAEKVVRELPAKIKKAIEGAK